jgi:hypothetical protein
MNKRAMIDLQELLERTDWRLKEYLMASTPERLAFLEAEIKPRDTGATRALTVAEAADYLSVDLATIYRLPKRKELPAFNLNPA